MRPNVVSSNLLTDNPELYEHQFPDPDEVAARFVADLVARFDGGTRLLDIGSGTGRDAAAWARRGFEVVGLDVSERMVEHARRRCPDARFEVADMRGFTVDGEFDVITCLDSALLYCHTNAELAEFLRRCHEHLAPGGLLITESRSGAFFLGNTELLDGPRTRSVRWRGVDHHSTTTLWVEHATQLLRRRRVWRWPDAEEPLVQTSAWRLLFPQELRLFLAHAGFEVLALFDEPGPRTDRPWSADAELAEGMAGDRLHVVARRMPLPG